jgi:hypothetical protein
MATKALTASAARQRIVVDMLKILDKTALPPGSAAAAATRGILCTPVVRGPPQGGLDGASPPIHNSQRLSRFCLTIPATAA